ncbi:MAG: hypothetical protein ACC707_21415, partial [Thiohalomonadales bacterium]
SRLKWLFFSILLIYLLLTPGRPIFESLHSWFTYEGLYLGLLRVSALVVLILAVNLLIQVKQQAELSYAIIWLLSPLKYLGFPVDKLAIRISLTFKYVDELQTTLIKIKGQNADQHNEDNYTKGMVGAGSYDAGGIVLWFNRAINKFSRFFDQAISRSVILIEEIIHRVEMPNTSRLENNLQRVPQLYQWLLPLGLVVMYISV